MGQQWDAFGLIRAIFTLDTESGMSDRDRISLSPIEKWKHYKRFPFKLVIHAALLALVTIQIFIVVTQFTAYARSNEQLFGKFFLDLPNPDVTTELFSVEEFQKLVQHVVDQYYTFDDDTISRFVLDINPESGQPEPITLELHIRPDTSIDNAMIVTESYELTYADPLGPLNVTKSKLKSMLAKTAGVNLIFIVSSIVPTQFFNAPFRWTVNIAFQNDGGIFRVQVHSTRHIENQVMLFKLGWVPILVIIVATLSLTLGIKATVASFQIYRRTKDAFESIPKERLLAAYQALAIPGLVPLMEWKDIPFGVKMDFFGSWYGLEILGEVCLLIGCYNGLIADLGMPISDFSRIFLGTGFLIVCVGFARYLEYWKKFYMLIITMQGSFQRNLRFVVSVVPLYMGFCCCGFIIFSPYTDDFSSLDNSAITLFALLNGDDIHESFRRIFARYPYPVIGQVFLFTFIIMFITLVLNIFLFIIEDAYHAAKDYINTNSERHSRVHRRKDPYNAIPRLGDIEFDLPTLFDLIEESLEHIPPQKKKNIRKRPSRISRFNPLLNSSSPSINADDIVGSVSYSELGGGSLGGRYAGAVGYGVQSGLRGATQLSSTYSGKPTTTWGGRMDAPLDFTKSPTVGDETKRIGTEMDSSSAPGPINTTIVSLEPISDSISSFAPVSLKPALKSSSLISSQPATFDLNRASSTEVQNAITATIASSQAEFLLEVDEKMKQMRHRFALKLQQDLERLLSNAPPMPSGPPAPSSSRSIQQPPVIGTPKSVSFSSSLEGRETPKSSTAARAPDLPADKTPFGLSDDES